jgi:hypothetical protein
MPAAARMPTWRIPPRSACARSGPRPSRRPSRRAPSPPGHRAPWTGTRDGVELRAVCRERDTPSRRARSTAAPRRGASPPRGAGWPPAPDGSATSGWTVPPPKLWVFSTTTSEVTPGRARPRSCSSASRQAGRAARARWSRCGGDARERRRGPELGTHDVRQLVGRAAPRRAARAGAGPSWLAREPVGANSPASWPSSPATALLQRPDGGVLAEDVVTDLGVRHRLAHGRGGPSEGVGQQVGAHDLLSPVQHLGDEEGQLEALLVVQARVADRLVAQVQVGVEDLLGATDALGDVVAGELDVDAAGHRARGPVHLEEAFDLLDDVVEVAGLVARRRLEGVAVHRVAHPGDRGTGCRDLLDDGEAGPHGCGPRPCG